MASDASFETLPLPKKDSLSTAGSYRVYKDATDFTMIAASTALEAMKTSGMEAIYKIERYDLSSNNVLDPKMSADILLKDEKAPEAAPVAAGAEVAAAAPETPAT
jgi:hypothetical protein